MVPVKTSVSGSCLIRPHTEVVRPGPYGPVSPTLLLDTFLLGTTEPKGSRIPGWGDPS